MWIDANGQQQGIVTVIAPNCGAAFASLRAHAQLVPVLVDLMDANEERGESDLRKIHLNDNRRTTARLARNW